jgi:hypothetical protein
MLGFFIGQVAEELLRQKPEGADVRPLWPGVSDLDLPVVVVKSADVRGGISTWLE